MEWIDAEIRKPEYDHDVVVVFDDGGVYVGQWVDGGWRLCGNNHPAFQTITHWAHFPDVPISKSPKLEGARNGH